MEYAFQEIEKKWKEYWEKEQVYKVSNQSDKPKFYILDMFPYPSGAGLHVGHPLGYIASDIYARYKRMKGFNVLHPMGFDAFGLPAEQYAMETGQHPAITTEKNIARYREQLDNIGFCYDWSREFRTSDPKYYKWTQWIFLQLFHSWYNHKTGKAESIDTLIAIFEKEGNTNTACPGDEDLHFTAEEWKNFSTEAKRNALMQYRLAYLDYAEVWWCEALGTVLANDEVVNGVSERGGHPVIKKQMRQWFLRITEYADRLLSSLDTLEWTEAMKEMQRNWIGKSQGAEIKFDLLPSSSQGGGGVDAALNSDNTPATGVDNKTSLSFGEGRGEAGHSEAHWQTAEPSLYASIKDFRNNLKKNPTEAENILWQAVRDKQLGAKFRRQHIIGRFIADFVSITHKLIIEVDGGIHLQQIEADKDRTTYLNEKGYTVIRFTNEEVIGNLAGVLNKIKSLLPSSSQGGGDIVEEPGEDYLTFGLLPSSSQGGGDVDAALNSDNTSATGVDNNTSLSFGEGRGEASIDVFTTRPDTIFGVDFMVVAPEHKLVDEITTAEQKEAIAKYKEYVQSRSERERMSEVKQVTGCFTGAYAVHPFTGNPIPVWTSEYVLAGYGTGAIMAVPSGDDRDHAFAKHFNIPITNIFGEKYTGEAAYSEKTGTLTNSDFLNGLDVKAATEAALKAIEEKGIGKRKVNYRLRDAGFSRQRYWGEPFPIVYVNDIPYGVDENELNIADAERALPVALPDIEKGYKPGPEGQGPLANLMDWVTPASLNGGHREVNTMPGYAGSSWYFLRYMDPHNEHTFADRAATDYWKQVDIYIGGTEHAVGHLLYSRMWTKALHDLGYISFDEPFRKLVNQGMIQGSSRFVYRERGTNTFISAGLKGLYETDKLHVDVNIVDGLELNIEAFKNWREEYADASFILEDGKYICGAEVEKMSKRWFNVVNPDDVVAQYGADTFRMYEMFLGPIEQSKPWETKGIEGVHRFLKKFWRLYFDEQQGWIVNDNPAEEAALRALHKTIKKIADDTERFAFNTCVSQLMICVNELTSLNCHSRQVLEPLVAVICPFAPHLAEELWHKFGHTDTVVAASFPAFEEKYVVESSKKYPVAVNGKTRTELEFAIDADQATIEKTVLADETVIKWLEGKTPKKIIFVQGRMINIVI
ncbi:leucine--tRNA ligase [Taibaiella soli]|uniref:Leucine--tRNA ligase n=1 Tax=Taibaiella soli TaxID=1649169 RepID=A0A2W2B0E8_9BACT|nr:leucine--tRNA ligase [Taibaiella soli]PZF73448.1 leucine--tRNA ligase [Taibaiella soli]